MSIGRLRESTRQKLLETLPPPVATITLTLIKRIEQTRIRQINEALEPFTTDATIELKDEETLIVRSKTPFNLSRIRRRSYIFIHKTGEYFMQRKSVACSALSLQPFELVAQIVKARSKFSLSVLQTWKNSVVTVRRGIHHASLNSYLDAIDYVSKRSHLYEKLIHEQPKPIDLLDLPDFQCATPIEMPESVYEKAPSVFIEEQKIVIKALTRQTSSTFVLTGAPGTGKTFVIVEAALRLLMAGARILFISTFFITADSIAQEFVNRGLTDKKLIFRVLGNTRDTSNINAEWLQFSEPIHMPATQNIADCSVVITTCCLLYKTMIINKQRLFTHVFIDDAQYTSEKSAWDVLYNCGHNDLRLILCGNPYQNYFENTKIVKELQTPLFRIVSNAKCDANSNWLQTLTLNRRSHKAIVEILARLCYEDNLKPMDSNEHNGLAYWECLPNPGFPVMFHNVSGEVKNGVNLAEAEVVIGYLKSLRKLVDDTRIHLSSNRMQIKHIRSHFDPSVNVFSRLFDNRYPRAYIVSYVDNGDDPVLPSFDEVSDSDDENDENAKEEIMTVCDTASEVPTLTQAKQFSFNPTYLNRIMSSTSELVVVVGHAATLEQRPAWKQFLAYCRNNNSYIE